MVTRRVLACQLSCRFSSCSRLIFALVARRQTLYVVGVFTKRWCGPHTADLLWYNAPCTCSRTRQLGSHLQSKQDAERTPASHSSDVDQDDHRERQVEVPASVHVCLTNSGSILLGHSSPPHLESHASASCSMCIAGLLTKGHWPLLAITMSVLCTQATVHPFTEHCCSGKSCHNNPQVSHLFLLANPTNLPAQRLESDVLRSRHLQVWPIERRDSCIVCASC